MRAVETGWSKEGGVRVPWLTRCLMEGGESGEGGLKSGHFDPHPSEELVVVQPVHPLIPAICSAHIDSGGQLRSMRE